MVANELSVLRARLGIAFLRGFYLICKKRGVFSQKSGKLKLGYIYDSNRYEANAFHMGRDASLLPSVL